MNSTILALSLNIKKIEKKLWLGSNLFYEKSANFSRCSFRNLFVNMPAVVYFPGEDNFLSTILLRILNFILQLIL